MRGLSTIDDRIAFVSAVIVGSPSRNNIVRLLNLSGKPHTTAINVIQTYVLTAYAATKWKIDSPNRPRIVSTAVLPASFIAA